MRSLLAVLIGALLLLGGCIETRFESPLGDDIAVCDARLKGLWADPDAPVRGTSAVYVDDECRVLVLSQTEPGTPLRQIHVPVNFAKVGRHDYLVIADAELDGLVDIPPVFGVEPAPQRSFYFVRYRIRGDRLVLARADSETIATFIIDGELEGTVSSTKNELHVFVEGDRAKMLDIVRRHDLFRETDDGYLVHRDQDIAAFERELLDSQAADKPAR